MTTLGEVGPHDDASYTGEVSSTPLSLDYFRTKFGEFQQCMNAADQAYQAGLVVSQIAPSDEIDALLTDYESRSVGLKTTAEAMNAGAAIVNAMGGRLPVLSIPQTLGLPPLVVPAAVVAAVAAAAAYVSWSLGYVQAMTRAIEVVNNSTASAEAKAEITRQLQRSRDAARIGSGTSLALFSGPVKLIGIGILAFLAYRAFNDVMDR
jgi:hypothetical protein